jgi:hypothetical protein
VHNASVNDPVDASCDYGCGKPPGKGNLVRESSKLIVEGEAKLSQLVGWEKHHLIEVSARFRILERAEKLGYDINRSHNGIALPSYGDNYKFVTGPHAGKAKTCQEAQLEALVEDWPLHKGRHAAAKYGNCVRDHLNKLEQDWIAGRVTDKDICMRLYQIEEKLLEALLKHEIYLNRFDPHLLGLTVASLQAVLCVNELPISPQ